MHTTKKALLAALLMAGCLPAKAWDASLERHRSVYLEVPGGPALVSVNYDSRFRPGSHWGYRTGLGYTYSGHFGISDFSDKINGVSIPLELNFQAGRRKSRFEAGLGANLGYYHERYSYAYITTSYEDDGFHIRKGGTVKGTHQSFGYFLYANVGYRLQLPRGFQFRIGLSPSFNFGGKHALTKLWSPYMSFGYAF